MVLTIVQNEDGTWNITQAVPESGWSRSWKNKTTGWMVAFFAELVMDKEAA